jgi:hypothetical protein
MTVAQQTFLSTGAMLLAGFTADAVLPSASAVAATGSSVAPAGTGDLALHRPLTVSSADHAPTRAQFAVDLQAPCEIEAVTLVFDGDYSSTIGDEILSSGSTSFTLDVSADGKTWQSVYQADPEPGAEVEIPMLRPVTAQYVRMTSTARSHTNPVGLSGIQVYGSCPTERLQATGWSVTLDGFDTGAGRHVWLEFDGVDREAVAWVDGKNVGTLTRTFARAALDITSALSGGASAEHVLAVQASGWDWTPAVRDRATGIWDHVRLRLTGDAVIGDPHVTTTLPKLPDTSVAEVTIAIPVSNAGTVTRTIKVTASFDDVTVSGSVSVAAGQSATVTFAPADHPQLTVYRPRLWWPNGYGEPALHGLEVAASIDGAASDRRGCRFGIREFGYSYDEPVVFSPPGKSPLDLTDGWAPQTVNFARQRARYVRIKRGLRATQWGGSLWAVSVFDTASSSPIADLALNGTAAASFVDLGSTQSFDQVVVVWGQDYATSYTIQVSNDGSTWTDVLDVDNMITPLTISCNGVKIFCRGKNSGWDEPLRQVPPGRVTQTVAMHRDMNFTMIRNWIGGGNREELYAACDENGILVWNDFWDDGTFPDDRPGYVAMATDTIQRYRIHPCIAVWCGVNEAPLPQDLNAGLAIAVATENPEVYYQDNSASEVWNHYDWSPIGNQQVDASKTLSDFCTKAPFVNYESMRAIFEAWTANLWRNTSAALLPMSHPAWPSTAWQTYDDDLDVNGAYYGARKGCEPLHIQANPTTWQTLAANHTPQPVTGATITASVYGLDGTLYSHAEQQGLNIAAADIAPGLTVAWSSCLPDLHLVRLQLTDKQGSLLSQNTYWRYTDATEMTALNNLDQTRLVVRLSGSGDTDLTATITNRGLVVAAMVRLSLQDQDGARILPTQYGDNYLWLLPGESCEVAISRLDGSSLGRNPQLVAEAYNSAAVTASLPIVSSLAS